MPSNLFCTEALEREVLQYRWSAALFRSALSEGDALRRGRMRRSVLAGTLAECARLRSGSERAATLLNEEEQQQHQKDEAPKRRRAPCSVRVVASDALDLALWLHEKKDDEKKGDEKKKDDEKKKKDEKKKDVKKRTTLLVMASRARLGGGYRSGASAQEEHIYRSSSISLLHDPDAQLATELSMMICENVTVVRGSERHGYVFVPKFKIRTISMAGIAHPQIEVCSCLGSFRSSQQSRFRKTEEWIERRQSCWRKRLFGFSTSVIRVKESFWEHGVAVFMV